MPVIINYERCDSSPNCFAARVCSYRNLRYNQAKSRVEVDAKRCGDCPAPCLNFCDHYAIKFSASMEELKLMQAELDGSMSADEIAEKRKQLAEEKKAKEEAAFDPLDLTMANFEEEILSSDQLVVVHVGTDRSPHSKELAPAFRTLAREYAGKAKFGKVDADKQMTLCQRLGIRSLPTVLFFYHGQIVDAATGPITAADLQGRVYNALLALQGPGGPEEPQEPGLVL